jgi:hypothetical protein
MITLPASEIKRRGVAVLEEHIKNGPIHIIKNNQPACVVLSEEDYASLLSKARQPNESVNLWDLLDHRPWSGKRTKKDIKNQLKGERDSWKK